MELPEMIVGVVILGIFALWVVAAIWAFKQIRIAIKTKTVSAKLVIAVLVLVYVAYGNVKSFLF
jgi:prepilin-type N-terminal cleavage/methylation domain-containing protein